MFIGKGRRHYRFNRVALLWSLSGALTGDQHLASTFSKLTNHYNIHASEETENTSCNLSRRPWTTRYCLALRRQRPKEGEEESLKPAATRLILDQEIENLEAIEK